VKNFPHQINQLQRLTDGLRVFARLIDRDESVDDDGVIGDALARSGVYTFRNAGGRSIETLLASEHSKPRGSQGTRTCARDLRRFFGLLGFIGRDENGAWHVSGEARELLRLTRLVDERRVHELWRAALLELSLTDERGTSHPYRILLRIVAALPGVAKPYSGLCLEARNDSDSEFRRILRIASRPNATTTMDELVGAHMARDSIKILPSLAEQLGDIVNDHGRLTTSSRVADTLLQSPQGEGINEAVRNLTRRQFIPRRRRVGGPRRGARRGRSIFRRYDPDLIGERFDAHEDCLDRFSEEFPEAMDKLHAIYDLLIVRGVRGVLLVEAKTIRADERLQVRLALGQLYFYEHFEIRPLYPDAEILKLLLADAPISEDLCEFLTRCEVGVVWMGPDGVAGGTELGLRQLEQFGVS
jgi:hypothetical protein